MCGITWIIRAKIVAVPFAGDDLGVDASGDVVALARGHAGEAFVMAEVEVGLRAVVGDEHLAMLVGLIVPGSTLM